MLVFLGTACSKNRVDSLNNEKTEKIVCEESGRLKFSSQSGFLKFMKEVQDSTKMSFKEKLINNEVDTYKFISLKSSFETRENATTIRSVNNIPNELTFNDDGSDPLVPDPYLTEVLNENREIEIDNHIFKITEYGTFICTEDKFVTLLSLINSMKNKTEQEVNSILTQNPVPSQEVGDTKLYEILPGIFRYDSYQELEEVTPITESTGNATSNNPINDIFLDQYIYDQLPTYEFDSHTFVGGLIQSVFGRTKPHKENFDSQHRIKVNFYDVDFGFYASAGVNVKMQTKGWTGIWRKLDTEEIRLGWDGLEVTVNFKGMPVPPKKQDLSFEKVKLGQI